MASGWIKLHRDLLEKPIWLNSTPEQKSILVTLLLMADHEPHTWEWGGVQFKVEPGEFVTSVKSICEASGEGISRQNTRTALKRFNKLEFLTMLPTKHGVKISIINWDTYQSQTCTPNQPANQKVTKRSPKGNQKVTTNKKLRSKEVKKEPIHKKTFLEVVNLTEDEHTKLIKNFGKPYTEKAIELLNNYKASNGKKYKSDYHAILSWVMDKVKGNGTAPKAASPVSDNFTCRTCGKKSHVIVSGECPSCRDGQNNTEGQQRIANLLSRALK